MTFTFVITPALVALAHHAIEHAAHQRQCYTKDGTFEHPALLLVKDEGAYLMSCFTAEGAPKEARLHTAATDKLVVVYADGAHPDDGHIGGDDFGEDIEDLPAMIIEGAKAKRRRVVITLTSETINAEVL